MAVGYEPPLLFVPQIGNFKLKSWSLSASGQIRRLIRRLIERYAVHPNYWNSNLYVQSMYIYTRATSKAQGNCILVLSVWAGEVVTWVHCRNPGHVHWNPEALLVNQDQWVRSCLLFLQTEIFKLSISVPRLTWVCRFTFGYLLPTGNWRDDLSYNTNSSVTLALIGDLVRRGYPVAHLFSALRSPK